MDSKFFSESWIQDTSTALAIELSSASAGYARRTCYEERSVDDSFARGARLFDLGEFFEAHEVWEERWRVATDKVQRDFLQGLIQVAAAFHKLLVMKSAEGASRLLAKGLAKLDACPTQVQGVDLAAFRERLRACATDLAEGHLTRAEIPTIGV
jgi:predicted metal-dependent hydrolase